MEYETEASRSSHELRCFGCHGGVYVTGSLLAAVARGLSVEPIELPRLNEDGLWNLFKRVLTSGRVSQQELHLQDLSYGERFAIAVGISLDTRRLPRGECFSEILDSVYEEDPRCGCFAEAGQDRELRSVILRAMLRLDSVQSYLEDVTLRRFQVDRNQQEKRD
ncbi:hypothetical protein [Stenotrophomonas maltophilia]|uniref:hypothetical protein n=1 Tax=Stenotrophomonas maltophilia TaxID=40324 RepID=UPI0013DC5DEB|nr:hypothetical protein [Stenotrophomonas maltophilia]